MVAANLLRKTATELFEMGLRTQDLPKGIQLKTYVGRDKKPFYRLVTTTKIPDDFLKNKVKKHSDYRTGKQQLEKNFSKNQTLKEAFNTQEEHNKIIFGKYKKLNQETLNNLLKTDKYKNLKGAKAIVKQLRKDNYLSEQYAKPLESFSLQKYDIPENFKIREGAELISPQAKKLAKDAHVRKKKIVDFIQKNPSLFVGSSREKTKGIDVLAKELNVNSETIKSNINSLLGFGKSKNILGLKEIIVPDKVKNIMKKLPTKRFFEDDLRSAGYSTKTVKLQRDIVDGLKILGGNRKNFDHTLPLSVIRAAKLPRSYKARGEHHSFAFNMAKRDYDEKLARLVVQRQNRVNGGEGLTASQYKKEVDNLREFFGEMTGGYKPGYITIADDGTVAVKDAGRSFIRDKINDVGVRASGVFKYFENAKYHNALWKNYHNPKIRNAPGNKEFFNSMEKAMSIAPRQLDFFKTKESLEVGAVKAYDEIMKRGFTQENLMDLYIQNPNNIFFQTIGVGKMRKGGVTPEIISQGGERGQKFIKDILPRTYEDGGRVNMSIGGLTGSKGGLNLDDRVSKVGTLESMLAGVGAGLIDIPKGAFTLGAALLDMGFGTSNAAKVEKYFDDLTTFDEKAEQTFAGDLTRIMVNLGVPGGFAFKKGADLATKAMLHKRNGNYFRLTDPKLQERFNTSLNAKGRLFATLGGAGAAGVSDMIFVGDPEHVGTIGDMFGGPTQLRPNDENSASREVANRMKFGLDSSLLIGAVGGLGSSIKSLIRRRNELESNNDAIDKFLAYLRPRGKKTQEFFDIERENLGLRRSDINRAEEISRQLDKHIDAIFPFVKNPFNKLGNDGRREFMAKLNDTLLSGDYRISAETGKTEFGLMDKKLVKEITDMMYKKGGSREDVEGVINEFYNIRAGWQLMFDDLGTAMGKDALTEFAPIFGKKFKDYLGSTYEIFRNKSVIPMLNYKPTEQAVEKMIKLFTESAADKGVKLEREQAEYYVNELISTARPPKAIATKAEKTSGVYFNAPDFFVNKTTLADLETPPKTLPLESLTDDAKRVVEELLGKVEDPLQTILTGTNRLSLLTRRNQLFQTLNKSNQEILEKRAKFIAENPGKEIPAALRGMFRETELEAINDLGKNIKKIELDPSRTEEAGIVNPLDGLYAERGVAEAIEETAMIARDKSSLFQLYQNFILYPKATSQLAKTVLSPITHARNFISAGAFAAANGIIPGLTVSPDDTVRAFREAYGALQVPGARLDNTRYRELLRLGVVNTNVRLGDLQKLLKDVNFGEKFDSNVALRNMMRPLSKLKKWTEDMYTAEDDFWKITTFAIERSRLEDTYKKFGMKYTKELLDEEAAKIVKNNVPNYDYVNDFVKDLRQLPFGNFVSFPAEIYRTGYNIMNQAWKEIFTTHTLADGRVVTPFRNIGMKRMFGLASTVVGVPYGTVEAFKAIHDVTEEEMAALRRFVPEWSKNSTLVPIRDEDGTLKYVDFSHANAYDTLIRPITTLMNGVQQGLEEDAVFKNTFLAMIDATKETASPFVSESIWTQALFDVSPLAGRGGRTLEGRRLWTDETPWGDAFYSGLKHLGATIVPGSLPALGRMRDALTETVDEYGRSYEFLDEALGVAGMRVVDVDPVRSMKFKIADFRTGINNSRREFTGPLLRGGPITPEHVVDQFQKPNDSLFRVQKKMFQDYYAARTLGVSDRALENTFQDRVSNKQVRAIQTGRFTPFIPSENIEQAFADNARAIGEPDAYRAARSQIQRLIRRYQRLKMGDVFPLIDNPFRATISERAIGPISQLGGTPLDNTSLAQPLIGGQQVATAQRGQQVFGSTDPIFGTT